MLEAELREIDGEQVVVVPPSWRLPGTRVNVERVGRKLVLEPVSPARPPSTAERQAFWDSIDALMGDDRLDLVDDFEWSPKGKSPARPHELKRLWARIDARRGSGRLFPEPPLDEPAPESPDLGR